MTRPPHYEYRLTDMGLAIPNSDTGEPREAPVVAEQLTPQLARAGEDNRVG
jgi:hypothetical protein